MTDQGFVYVGSDTTYVVNVRSFVERKFEVESCPDSLDRPTVFVDTVSAVPLKESVLEIATVESRLSVFEELVPASVED